MTTQHPSVSVLVPSYRRPEYLSRCLEGLRTQTRLPDQIVVVRRANDVETAAVVAAVPDERVVEVTVSSPSAVTAIAAGLRWTTGDIIAFTDDDAVPRSQWLERLLRLFETEEVGAAGGRDIWVATPPEVEEEREVGWISSWGKLRGNHHLGSGGARDVMVLKGANMAFRREALAVPAGLRGDGAEPHFEIAMALWARNRGWRVIYDPSVEVDHFRAPRLDVGFRDRPYPSANRNRAYNLVLCLLSLEPRLFRRRALYGLFVGDRGSPGLARGVVGLLRGEFNVARAVPPSLAGQAAALAAFARGVRVELRPLSELGRQRETHQSIRHRAAKNEEDLGADRRPGIGGRT